MTASGLKASLRFRQRNSFGNPEALFLLLVLSMFLWSAPSSAQAPDLNRKIAAMEQTVFAKTFCKDKPIRRIERLEENFMGSQQQKEKDLPSRINDLMEKIKPTQEMLQMADPCSETQESKSSIVNKILGGSPKEDDFIESNQYPVIKWKPINILQVQESVAQLTSDFDTGTKSFGKLKYKILLKLPDDARFPRYFTVTFYDHNGFKLNKFVVSSSQFKETGRANHWEANESVAFPEKDYKKAKSYSIDSQ